MNEQEDKSIMVCSINCESKTLEECITCIKTTGGSSGCKIWEIIKNLIERVEALESA